MLGSNPFENCALSSWPPQRTAQLNINQKNIGKHDKDLTAGQQNSPQLQPNKLTNFRVILILKLIDMVAYSNVYLNY